jgi:hypothetical protein
MSSLLKTKCVGGGIDLHRKNMISLSSLSTPSFNLFPDANGRENLCCVNCKVFSGDIIRIAQSPGMMGPRHKTVQTTLCCVSPSLSLSSVFCISKSGTKNLSAQTHKSNCRRKAINLEVRKLKRPFWETEKSSFELTKGFSYCYFPIKLTDAACGGSESSSSSCVPCCSVLFSWDFFWFTAGPRARFKSRYDVLLLFCLGLRQFHSKTTGKWLWPRSFLPCLPYKRPYSGKTRKGRHPPRAL